MSETIKYCEHKITMLEKVNKILNDTNKSLHESTERLVKLNEKQQEMLGTLNESLDKVMLLETELENVKKENVKLKVLSNDELVNVQHPFVDKHSQGITKTHNLLLQKKIVDLEKQLSQSQTCSKGIHSIEYDDEHVSKLKDTNNTLLLQNRLLKNQLINFQHLHYQTMSEYRLNNIMNADGSQQKNNISIYNMNIDSFNQDELQPLQVYVIDSDVEDSI